MNRLLPAVAVFASGPLFAADPPKLVVPQVIPPTLMAPAVATLPARVSLAPKILVAAAAANVPAGDRLAIVNVMIVQVPHDFAETAGLLADPKKPTRPAPLSSREAKLLSALLKADKRCEILSHPQLCLVDAQTGFFQVGQAYDVLGPLTVTEEKGERVVKGKITQKHAGITLRLTPKIAADAKAMTLKAELQYCGVGAQPVAIPTLKADGSVVQTSFNLASIVDLGNGQSATTFDTQTVQTNVALAVGETVVIGGLTAPGKAAGGQPDEVLAIIQGVVSLGTKK